MAITFKKMNHTYSPDMPYAFHALKDIDLEIEEKKITHFRKGEPYTFPCNCQVVMAANPCPCGYLGDRDRECTCTQADLEKYINLFGYLPQFGVDGKPIGSVTYKPQPYNSSLPLYEK